jgi:GTPase SAR1 family protein
MKMDLGMIMFDVTNNLTFENSYNWRNYIESIKQIPLLLIGNKID